jgi:hypothetical protein
MITGNVVLSAVAVTVRGPVTETVVFAVPTVGFTVSLCVTVAKAAFAAVTVTVPAVVVELAVKVNETELEPTGITAVAGPVTVTEAELGYVRFTVRAVVWTIGFPAASCSCTVTDPDVVEVGVPSVCGALRKTSAGVFVVVFVSLKVAE